MPAQSLPTSTDWTIFSEARSRTLTVWSWKPSVLMSRYLPSGVNSICAGRSPGRGRERPAGVRCQPFGRVTDPSGLGRSGREMCLCRCRLAVALTAITAIAAAIAIEMGRRRRMSCYSITGAEFPHSWYCTRLEPSSSGGACILNCVEESAEAVGDAAGDEADQGHLQAAGPPGAGGDEAFGRADDEVRAHADDRGRDDCRDSVQEEEGQDGDNAADGGGDGGGG